jgi:hypothetical protein
MACFGARGVRFLWLSPRKKLLAAMRPYENPLSVAGFAHGARPRSLVKW